MIDQTLGLLESIHGGLAIWGIVMVLIICGLGLPLPEEIPLFAAGYLAHRGSVSLGEAILLPTLAIIVGDSMIFTLGFHYGHQIFKMKIVERFITPEMLKKVNHYFHKYGNRVVFVARFLAGARAPVFLMAGVLKMPYRRFVILDGMAALISAPLIVWITYHFFNYFDGETGKVLKVVRNTEKWLLIGVMSAVLIVSVLIYRYQRKKKKNDTNDVRSIDAERF